MSQQCYIPPPNFGMIEEDLYRSGLPSEVNFSFLDGLNIKTVVYLAPDRLNDNSEHGGPYLRYLKKNKIELIDLGGEQHKTPWKPVSEDVVIKCLEILLDSKYYPVHVMCHRGRHRTGTVVGCLRKLQNWSLSSIFEEYRRHAGSKVRLMNEQFIELFDTELVSNDDPQNNKKRPKWL